MQFPKAARQLQSLRGAFDAQTGGGDDIAAADVDAALAKLGLTVSAEDLDALVRNLGRL